MAAVLGGAQSLHTNSLDEAWALPSEHAATLALRTQQVIAYESGITAAPDPFGGSHFVEQLTCEMEAGAREYIRTIDGMGGMVAAIAPAIPQSEIARAAYDYQRKVEAGARRHRGRQSFPARGRIAARDPAASTRRPEQPTEKLRRLRKESA